MNKSNLIITIDRQKGSGGNYLGRRLAEKLNLSYYDDEIVREAAKELKTSIEELESSDEKQGSILKSALSYSAQANFRYYPEVEIITDEKAHLAESNVIIKVANEKSAVIIGRAGSYILRDYPKRVSIFLHADINFRIKRTQQLNNISAEEAMRLIQKTDKQRLKYYNVFTGIDMYNACNYDLVIDTSKLGLEKSEALIMKYLMEQFGAEINKFKIVN